MTHSNHSYYFVKKCWLWPIIFSTYLSVATQRLKKATLDHKIFTHSLWKRVTLVK